MDHWPKRVTAVEPLGDHPTSIFPLFISFFLLLISMQQSREKNLKTPLPFIKGQSSSTKQLIFLWTKPNLLWVTAGHPVIKFRGSEGNDRGQTPDCNSHTFRHPPGAHLDPCTAGSCQELGHNLELLQAPSIPVISAAIFTIRGRNPRFLDFRVKTIFIHFEENCLHRSYCFWLSADLGFTSGSYYLSATTGNFLFFKQWISGWCSGRNSHQENVLVCQTTTIHPSLTAQRVGVQWSLGPCHCTARCLFGRTNHPAESRAASCPPSHRDTQQ